MLIFWGGGAGCNPKKPNATANFKFRAGFFGLLPPPPIRGPGYVIVHDREGKALTMTTTPWNLPHGQWSKKLTMATSSHPQSNFKLTILTTRNLNFDNVHGQNLDYLTTDIN